MLSLKTKKSFKIKNTFWLIIFFFLIVFSIKPFLFTYNYFIANYKVFVHGDISGASINRMRTINLNPESYRYFSGGNKAEIIIKAAIYYENAKIYNILSTKKKKKIGKKYKNNFYVQSFLNNLDKKRNWQHLDALSYFFLKDKRYNKLTISIFNRLQFSFDNKFLKKLCDFLLLNGNNELRNFVKKKYKLLK